MKISLYQVDAFTTTVFGGNPAAVCPIVDWPEDRLMQRIAEENNLSETAFYIDRGETVDIRWFTPSHEIDLAGHPTLAAAWVLFNVVSPERDRIVFSTRQAGDLFVRRDGNRIVMDFPSRPGVPEAIGADIEAALGCRPVELYRSRDWMAVLSDERSVREFSPEPAALRGIANERNGIIITAPGDKVDFVSRFFAPDLGINEDPVTGSAHCTLVPYWAERLGRRDLCARQLSERGGDLYLEHRDDRVHIGGDCVLYMEGQIDV